MKLIIDIPEEKYDWIMSHLTLDRNFRECMITPLPKGHGRLIDAYTLPVNEVSEEKYNWECGETTRNTLYVVYWEDILNAPTIIESDEGE
jgi:hypothetical protein